MSIISKYANQGSINVFIFKTESNLLGFAPGFTSGWQDYKILSPFYDVIFVSLEGLKDHNTLTHELGHWFSLDHPFIIDERGQIVYFNKEELSEIGINSSKEYCINHMNYSCCSSTFTDVQLHQQHWFAKTYRNYIAL